MFESKPQDEIDALMKRDSEFRVLYHHHRKLDSKVRDAEIGALPMDGVTLTDMKREKLRAKHKLTQMWAERSQTTH